MDRVAAAALDAVDPLAGYRREFAIDDAGPIYLDGNSLGLMSHRVAEAIAGGVADWQARAVGGWHDWIDLHAVAGDKVGSLIGAGPGQVLVSDSTTVNLYKLAGAALDYLAPQRVDVVCDAGEFPTDRYVLEGLVAARDGALKNVRSDPVGGVDLDRLAGAIDGRTALVCLSQVNYRSGARLDMAAVTELVRSRGALILWDLCHSAGAVPVDLDGVGADLAVGCTYKYLNAGPGAPAFLYVRRGLQKALRSPIWGWFAQRDQFEMGEGFDPVGGVGRFAAGTPPVLGMLAVAAGADLLSEAGVERLWAKSQAMTAALVTLIGARLEPLGAALGSPADPSHRGAHVSVTHPDAWPWCTTLIERGLVLPDFRTPDSVRLGPAPLYTRFVDLVDAVERMEAVLAGGLRDGWGAGGGPDSSGPDAGRLDAGRRRRVT